MAKYININGEELKTINVNGKEIEYDIDKFVEQYEKRGTLPSPKIVCTNTGTLVTAFGGNLKGKVEKYGNIRNLLETFVCRAAGGRAPSGNKEPETAEAVQKSIEDLQVKLEVLKKQAADAAEMGKEVGEQMKNEEDHKEEHAHH